jgi:hypothetical protein
MRLGDAIKDRRPERGPTDEDKVTVVEVEKNLLESIVPNASELAKLTHVRKRGEAELAVVIAKRLPKPSGFSTAHLVSLEDRFTGGHFNFKDAKNGDVIRLISLASFRFGCFEPKQSFVELLRALNKPGLRLDENGSSTLRLPETLIVGSAQESSKTQAREHLALGAVPMRYRMRTGQTAAAWYHGPLAPSKSSLLAGVQAPVQVADELVRYSSQTGMFDVSYAAAWEIGRLVALQNKKFSLALQQWKLEHAKMGQMAELSNAHPLANLNSPLPSLPLPIELSRWLDDLSLLEGVPFSYLVADERMLPLESIRFFWLDWFWIECLLDGAFSIGRHTNSDTTRDAAHKLSKQIGNPHPSVTGVILRSEVVSGWPGMQVDGYNKGQLLKTLRMTQLSPNVLLCLFEGEVTDVTFHQKMETLHFGVELDQGKLVKELRNKQRVDVVLSPDNRRILDLNNLVKSLNASTSADFASQMIDKVEEVTFSITQNEL